MIIVLICACSIFLISILDAEGRLVLGDGVASAIQHLNPEVIIDMATLTGAQGVATGKYFGALYTNDEGLEQIAVQAGRKSGDLCHPVPYAPEFFRPEFQSAVADMKNSVADRANAQVSCAGQFIGNHLGDYLEKGGKWLHIDMAYCAHDKKDERATGYGVALLHSIIQKLDESS
jgi:probable aminopeptidase NPEPL1